MEPIGPHVFLWAGLDQGSLRNHSGGVRDRKIEGKQAILRTYGFEGEAGQEGEGWTRIRESSYRRVKGLVGKVHIFRRSGFTKTLLCIPVMSPLHSSELLV